MNEKAGQVRAAALDQTGSPYVFGAWGGLCTPSYRRQYAGYNPGHRDAIYKPCPVLSGRQSACEDCKWVNCRAFDCRGFTYWCLSQAGIQISGGGATAQYNTAANWAAKGTIDRMPDCVCCVFRQNGKKMIHTGLHVGQGRVVHCSGTVKEEGLADGGWTHYAVPAGLYTDEELHGMGTVAVRRTLRSGSRGEDVRELQLFLSGIGFDCGTADGVFGKKTQLAVKAFQAAAGLVADGIVGVNTWGVLDACRAPDGAAHSVTYTVVLHGVTATDVEQLRADWPDMEVTRDG